MYIVEITFAHDPSSFENERGYVGPFSVSAEAVAWMEAVPDMDDLEEINVLFMNAVSLPWGMNSPEDWLGVDRPIGVGHVARRIIQKEE